jgi:hypothetical protein
MMIIILRLEEIKRLGLAGWERPEGTLFESISA